MMTVFGRVLRTGLAWLRHSTASCFRPSGAHPSRVEPTGETIRLTNYGISNVRDGGKYIRIYGWAWARMPRDGDYLILADQKGGTTRYFATNVYYPGNPRDMFFADAEFAPR